MNLSDFLTDLRDSEKTVLVRESQLRKFAQNSRSFEDMCNNLQQKNEILKAAIGYRDSKINRLETRVRELECKSPVTIDLFS